MKPSFAPRHEAPSASPSKGIPFCNHMSEPISRQNDRDGLPHRKASAKGL